jgi:hypothetical protein
MSVPWECKVCHQHFATIEELCDHCHVEGEPFQCPAVPAQEANKEPFFPREGDAEGLLLACHKLYDKLQEEKAHLNTIRNYVIEAAKTPITREDMHDPMKAQAFFDETEGFYRLVKSEIGGQNAK